MLTAGFLVVLNVSVVNLAIPSIRQTLKAGFGQIQFVIASYIIAYAIFLIPGGRLGDFLGRKRVFVAGVAIFTVAAAACGLAPTVEALIAARVLQGFGAALIYPQILSTIQASFEGEERSRALGLFGSVIGLGVIAGQLIGGVLISLDVGGLGWRPAFFVAAPIGVALLVVATALPAAEPVTGGGLDYAGIALLGACIALVTYPLMAGRDAGWPVWLVAMLALSLPATGLLVWFERGVARRGGAPLLDPALFRQKAFVVGSVIGVALFSNVAGFTFTLSVTLQVGLGFTPLQAGLALAPAAISLFLASLVAPRLIPGLGSHVLSLGYVLLIAGTLGVLATVHAVGPALSAWALVPAMLLVGIGQAFGLVPLVGTVLAGVRREDAGAASGVLATALQLGNVFGIAIVGLAYFAALGAQSATAAPPSRYLAAFAASLLFIAGLAILAVPLVSLLPRPAPLASNALLERVPNRLAGLAYSAYFLTGGHVGQRAMAEILQETIARRTARIADAPREPGAFLVHHFERAAEDAAWYRYLI
jgi:MFS family permease